MSITLTPEHAAWLNAVIARGDFGSLDDAIRQLIDARIAEEQDSMAWAQPLVDAALESVAAGRVLTLEEHQARNADRLRRLKG